MDSKVDKGYLIVCGAKIAKEIEEGIPEAKGGILIATWLPEDDNSILLIDGEGWQKLVDEGKCGEKGNREAEGEGQGNQ